MTSQSTALTSQRGRVATCCPAPSHFTNNPIKEYNTMRGFHGFDNYYDEPLDGPASSGSDHDCKSTEYGYCTCKCHDLEDCGCECCTYNSGEWGDDDE